jgi:hypothetical protein
VDCPNGKPQFHLRAYTKAAYFPDDSTMAQEKEQGHPDYLAMTPSVLLRLGFFPPNARASFHD